ncbi:head-tail connector protein [uncultured Sphingomonas sp.]|uniref:head-tail connector protein n=1 Tax=uncultured Sphingomonas sp. TaxID=158754 RepID=UPI0035CC582D
MPQGAVDGAVGAARAYLRIVGNAEDAVLGVLARAAIEVGEQFTGTCFVARTGETASPAPVLATDWDGLPAGIAHGVVMLTAHLFEARGRDAAPPAAVAALWRPHRRMRLVGVQA